MTVVTIRSISVQEGHAKRRTSTFVGVCRWMFTSGFGGCPSILMSNGPAMSKTYSSWPSSVPSSKSNAALDCRNASTMSCDKDILRHRAITPR
ncbi:hypothetical protein E2C01_011578 [Portunus trituberculatus]|uniref:Uncharacterized protein n=1 Tax=Portunus trituberculatus TaxID=210409 RepID=A0A5B7DCC6_PORTR|nr:hypothetical protein [Portunus trituberculatus]